MLKPGGTALITSENLTSFLNLGAMALGYTPFTLLRCCGWHLGNLLGLHYQKHVEEGVPITDPAFAGVTGRVRDLCQGDRANFLIFLSAGRLRRR